MSAMVRLGLILVCTLVGVALTAGPALAQCPPVVPNVRCWDGAGDGVSWLDGDNWVGFGIEDNTRPDPEDDVYHLTEDDVIQMDVVSDPLNPVEINSFTFNPALTGGLVIKAGKGLTVTNNFTKSQPGPVSYTLTIEPGALLNVQGSVMERKGKGGHSTFWPVLSLTYSSLAKTTPRNPPRSRFVHPPTDNGELQFDRRVTRFDNLLLAPEPADIPTSQNAPF